MLLVAAVFAGTTHQLSIPLVILAATSGAILGDNLGFCVATGATFAWKNAGSNWGSTSFSSAGARSSSSGALLPCCALGPSGLSGTNRMRWPRFLVFNAAGGIIWATLYGLGGYYLGDNIHRLTGPLGPITLALAVLLMLAGIVFVRSNEQ